jgi:branched-chain amino acid transport system permease protein
MGVKPDVVISATFIIGAVLAAIAGVMYASNYGTAQHAMGFLPGLKAFTAAVLAASAIWRVPWLGRFCWGSSNPSGRATLVRLTGAYPGQPLLRHFCFYRPDHCVDTATFRSAG